MAQLRIPGAKQVFGNRDPTVLNDPHSLKNEIGRLQNKLEALDVNTTSGHVTAHVCRERIRELKNRLDAPVVRETMRQWAGSTRFAKGQKR